MSGPRTKNRTATAEDPSGCLPLPGHPIEERHLEAALDILAHVIVTHGEVYAPIYDRLEAKLYALKQRRSSVDRARMRLSGRREKGKRKPPSPVGTAR